MTRPAVTALTRDQAESAVAAAAAQRDTIQANLLDLEASFGKRLLAGASLDGETQQRWAAASAALTRLWETFTAYSAVLDQAAEMLPRARKSAAVLADLTALLTGASVTLPTATSALASRDLTRTGTAAVTLAAAVGDMRRTYAGLAELVTTVERVWNELAGPVQDLADQLATARQQASGLADAVLDEAAGAAEASLAELRGLLNRDPLALLAGPGQAAARQARWIPPGWAGCGSRCPRPPPGRPSWPGCGPTRTPGSPRPERPWPPRGRPGRTPWPPGPRPKSRSWPSCRRCPR